jgi:hypothetical protein
MDRLSIRKEAESARAAAEHRIRRVFDRVLRPTVAVATAVFIAALVRGLLFWRDAPSQPYVDLSWDPASHVLIGLDLFDSLRRFDVVPFLKRAFNEHWWPPLFGLLTLPLHAVFGRSDLPARVLSLVSYALLPASCSVAVMISAGRSAVAAGVGIALTLGLFLTSPQLVEMSRWPMLESCAAAMGLASILAFSMTERAGWHRLSFVLAGLSTLLKYHYGFFLLITLTIGVVLRISSADRARLRDTAVTVLRKPLVAIVVTAAAVLLLLPADFAARYRWIPKAEGVPWVAYMAALLTIAAVPSARARARSLWKSSPVMVRDFVSFGLSIPGIWCLDPANARVWHRQIHLASEPPAVFDDQVHRLLHFVTVDYVSSAIVVLPLVFAGVIALLMRRRDPAVLPLAFHGIWPLLLMTGASYRAEARFLASLMPVLFAAGIVGWVTLLAAVKPVGRLAVSAALGVMLALTIAAAAARANDFADRKTYRYRYSPEEGDLVERATEAIAGDTPVLVILPNDVEVAPALRLFLRMRMPAIAPDDVLVMKGDPSELARRAARVRSGLIVFEKGWDHPSDLVTITEVPLHARGERSLLVTERRP